MDYTIFSYSPQRCSHQLHAGVCLSYRRKDGLRKDDYDSYRREH